MPLMRPSPLFEGLTNFRDIGGFTTLDGSTMKTRVIFRSGELSQLSARDIKTLRGLKLRLVCDLRTPRERKSKPPRVPSSEGLRIANIPIRQNLDSGRRKLVGFLFGDNRELDFERYIKDYYHGLAFDHTGQVKEILTLLSDEKNLPALIHCNAGKDRTGFISALIQLLVGVPRKTVLDDYLLTNLYYKPYTKKLLEHLKWMRLFKISPDRLKLILEARSDYLDDVLAEIFYKHGTIEGYLVEGCGVDQRSISNFKQLIVE